MVSKKEQQLAFRLAISLLVVGVLCYAAFPAGTPDSPVRIMFKNMAGKVMFDHNGHRTDKGYGLSCADCHHTDWDDHSSPDACGECHGAKDGEKDGKLVIKRAEAFHQQCETCHEDYNIGPEKKEDRCSWCHAL